MEARLVSPLEGIYLRARAILAVFALITVVGLIVALALNSGLILSTAKMTASQSTPLSSSTPPSGSPSPSPVPLFGSIVLTPANQTVSMNDDLFQTNFNITIGHNQNSIQFPCYIGIISSQPPAGKGINLGFEPANYGTYNFSLSGNASLKDKTISYYALIKDSDGALFLSNTVTVKYI